MSPRFLIPLCLSVASISFFFTRQFAPASPRSPQAPVALPDLSQTQQLESTQEFLKKPHQISDGPNQADSFKPTPSLQQILDNIRKKDLGPADARLEYLETIVKLSPDALEALVCDMTQNAEWLLKYNTSRFCFEFAVSRLAEVAPEKAANLWLSKDRLHSETDVFLGPWAQKDPQTFALWCLSLSPEAQLASASALGSIAFGAPEQFAAIAPLLIDSPAAAKAAKSAMEFFLRQSTSDAAIEYAKTLPAGSMRIAALGRFAQILSLPDPTTQPEVVAAIAALPRDEAFSLGFGLSEKSAILPAGPAREAAFYSDFSKQAGKDPLAAAARLEALVSPQDYSAAVRGFVSATAHKDPAAAADWALSIPVEASIQRADALDRVARAFVNKDPDAAKAWVESAPLSPEEYFVLTGRQRSR